MVWIWPIHRRWGSIRSRLAALALAKEPGQAREHLARYRGGNCFLPPGWVTLGIFQGFC